MKVKVQGFTLIELVVTMVILVVMVTAGVPALRDTYKDIRAKNGIRDIQQTLMYARGQAISYGASVTVCPNNSGSCGSDWSEGILVEIANPDGGQVILQQKPAFDTSDEVSFDGGSTITFNSAGLATPSGIFTYSPGGTGSSQATSSELSPSGKSRLLEQSGSY